MKKHLIILLIVMGCAHAFAQSLPVLKVTFPGRDLSNTEYKQGTMQLTDTDGSVTELPAKFKTRGATAMEYSMKPSFNMKLREEDGTEIDSSLCGIRSCSSWILDAMAIDRICMRNRVCFDIWNAFSKLPYNTKFDSRNGTEGKFVEVYMNNTYKGIYCLSDRINRKLLDLKKTYVSGDTVTIRGVLYKHGTTSILDQNTPGYFNDSTICVAEWHDAWELSEPEDYAGIEAWAPLQDFYTKRTDYTYVQQKFYTENIRDYILFIMALSIEDNWGNKNKFFSIRNITTDGNKNRIVITPWDLDTSLGGHYKGNFYDGNYSSEFTPKVAINSAIPPFSTCLKDPDFKQALKDRWIELRETVFAVDSVAKRMRDYTILFVKSGAWERQTTYWDQQKYKPAYVQNLSKEVEQIILWYDKRFAAMDEYFGLEPTAIQSATPTPQPTSPTYHDLSGRPVTNPTQGIYILNGKKTVLK